MRDHAVYCFTLFEFSSRDDVAMVVLNSPNNPSAAVYPPALLQRLAEILKKYPHIGSLCVCFPVRFSCLDQVVVSDEVYRTLLHGAVHTSMATYLPEQTLIVGGATLLWAYFSDLQRRDVQGSVRHWFACGLLSGSYLPGPANRQRAEQL